MTSSSRRSTTVWLLPRVYFPFRPGALTALCLTYLLCLAAGCHARRERSEHVALRLTTEELEPGSGFEVVFDDPVVRLEDIGSTNRNPLRIEPPLPGTFVWRSRRSGLFRPSEPMRLGTAYRFSLRAGLKDDGNRPVIADLERTLTTPSLVATLRRDGWWDANDVPVLPVLVASFNARVDAENLARVASFRDGHTRIPAVVEALGALQSEATEAGGVSGYNPFRQPEPTWAERFPGWTNLPPLAPGPVGRSAGFLLRPERPLDSTNEWRLEIAAGLKSPEAGVRLEAPVQLVVGRVVPFELIAAEAANHLSSGRQIRLRFSQPVTTAVTNQDLAAWFECRPAVTNLHVERSPGGRALALSGGFELDKTYEIRVRAGLAGVEPIRLKADATVSLPFEPIRPSVWLPEFDTVQLSSGRRHFDLLAVNTPETRLRLKSLDAHGLIPTLRAYERYLRDGRAVAPDAVSGAPLDYSGIPGRTVLDTNLVTVGPRDEAVHWERSWNDLLARPDVAAGPVVGAYFIEADLHHVPANETGSENRVGPQGIVQLTDLGLASKTGAEMTTVWVFSHDTARSLAGVSVSLRSEENEVLAESVTDGEGLVRLVNRPGAAWLLAELGADRHAQRLSEGQVSTWRFDIPNERSEPSPLRLFAFSDREAYRPGETVHLKVLARTWQRDGWHFSTNDTVELKLNGPRGDALLQTNLVLSDTGAGEWTWESPHGTRGTYHATLTCGEGTLTHSFEVRDFQPAAFEVTVGAQPVYAAGEPLVVPVQARYLFGQPLARAKVLWQVRAMDQAFSPTGWESFRFGRALDDWRLLEEEVPHGESVRQDTVQMTNGAPVVLTPDLPFNPKHPQPQFVQVLAEVTDLNQQTLSRQVEFIRHASEFYLGFRWTHGEEVLLTTNRPLAFQVVAVAADGAAAPAPVDVQARLRRVEWKSVAVLKAGRVVGRRSEPEYHDVAARTVRAQTVAQVGTRWQVATEGENAAEFPALAEPGAYVLDLRCADRAGRPVVSTISFAVSGDGHLVWHQRNGAQLDLVPDREEHRPGDVASLLVKAPFPGTAWVTVERDDVLRSFTTELRGNAPAVAIPLEANDGPNVFVGVTLVRGVAGNPHAFPMPEWRVGYHSLRVTHPQDQLHVTVTPAELVRAPGDPVSIRAAVRDATDGPIAGAEVTLYAVDEGFLLLTGATVPDPEATFYAPRHLGVSTLLSLPNLLPEDPELRRFENKGYLAGGGGRLASQRRNFIPCPYWNATLKTDLRGEVAVSFAAPDSLTRYRVVAVATRGAGAMGAGASSFEVRKNLMIEPALPRFAHVGDQLAARALVFNQGTNPLSVLATLQPGTNAVLLAGNPGTVRLEVPAGGIQVVEFPVHFVTPGADLWRWRVEADGLADATEAPLPVTRAEASLRDVRPLQVGAGGTNLLAGTDPAVLELPETATVRLALHPLALVGEGVEQLLHYPYGCVEQTGSSLLPWLALRDFPGLLPADRRAPTNFTAALAAGVQRFWSMQTAAGGLSYWPGGASPQRWGSAYAAWILALAQAAGTEVAPERLDRLQRWLNEQWRAEKGPLEAAGLEERCLTALALAESGAAEPALQAALFLEQERLSPEARGWLALAHLKSGGDPAAAATLLRLPKGKAARDGMGLFGNSARVTAVRLLAFLALDPTAPEVPGLVEELLGAGRSGHWVTTQGNGWALWALTEQARQTAGRNDGTATLHLGGDARTVVLDREHSVVTETFSLDPATVKTGLHLSQPGPGRLFVEVTVTGRRPTATNAVAAVDHGFNLQRTYARLDDQNQPQSLTGLSVGDRVLVTLDIDAPEAADWVAIEDPLPAVLEAVQGVFATEATAATALLPSWSSDFREVRLDRTFIFRDALPEGRHRIQYLARVRAAGEAVAAPAKIEAMYQPQRHGFSTGTRLRSVSPR